MPEIYECLISRSEITQLQVLDNNSIAYSTQLHGIKIFSSDCEVKINLSSEYLDSQTTAIAFSGNGKLLAFANKDIIYVISISTKKVITKIKTNKENIEILAFDPSSTYIIAGSVNGRVLQYKYNNTSLLARLCSFPYQTKTTDMSRIKQNFVSAFAFYKNKIACSGYGGSIFIVDLYSRSYRTIILHNIARTDALCFLDEENIISGNIDGSIHISSLTDKKVYKKINTPFLRIKQIIKMPHPEYILISSDSNYLALINIKTYKIVNDRYIECEDKVHKMALLNEESLSVALVNKRIIKIQLATLAKLQSLITHNSLDEAFLLVAKEPMIRDSNEHKLLEEKYQLFFTKAIAALTHNNRDLALQLTNMFKNIPEKRTEIIELFSGFEKYRRLQSLFYEKNYTLAYAMCSKYPALQQTPQYKKMEQIWKIAFGDAQRQMILKRSDIAKDILSKYMTIASKRPLINFILNNNKQFLDFLKAIENREFKKLDLLVKENDIFAQIPTYISLKREIQDSLNETQECLRVGNTKQALIHLKKLSKTPHLADIVAQLYNKSKNVQKLYDAYNNNKFLICYEILDSYKYLKDIEIGVLLEKHWSQRMKKAEEHALSGNLKALKSTLGELLKLPTRKEKIGELLRTSFHTKIKQLTSKKHYKNAENVIYSYIDIFGLDNEIEQLMYFLELKSSIKLAIVEDQQVKKPRNSWFNSDFIMR